MKILILEDNEERITAFQAAGASLSAAVRVWRNAHRMIAEVGEELARADILSLDHDLNNDSGQDTGSGMDMARYLMRLDWVVGAAHFGRSRTRPTGIEGRLP
jgi:hypothetical protein